MRPGKIIPNIYTAVSVLIFISAAVIYYLNCRSNLFLQDDVYTVFRYVDHFLSGKGLVFNPGERVEGYTSILWLLLIAAAKILGFSPESSAQFLSVFSGILIMPATVYLYLISVKYLNTSADKTAIDYKIFFVLPVILLSFDNSLIYWSVSGMEISMFTFILMLSLVFLIKDAAAGKPAYKFAVFSFINTLIRPEGTLLFCVIFCLGRYLNRKDEKERWREAMFNKPSTREIKLLAVYFVPFIAYVVFRLIYYGYPFPNTYYAKTDLSFEMLMRGFAYIKDFLISFPEAIFVLASFIWFRKNRLFILFYGIIAVYTLYILIIGGDVLPIQRFFIPLLPLIYILLVESIRFLFNKTLRPGKKESGVIIAVITAAVVFSYAYLNYNRNEVRMNEKEGYEIGLVTKMKEYAAFIKEYAKSSDRVPVVAASTIGALSYFSEAEIIDLVGLTDEFIAHNPVETPGIDKDLPVLWKERHYNSDYVMKRKPDFIIFPAGAKPSAFTECSIFINPAFRNEYYTQLFYSSKLNQLLPIFTSKAHLAIQEKSEYKNGSCRPGALVPYINAVDELLEFIRRKDDIILRRITENCDSAILNCPDMASMGNSLKGMAFYHADSSNLAEKYFLTSLRTDSLNSVSLFYLKNIYAERGDTSSAAHVIQILLKISPFSLGSMINNF